MNILVIGNGFDLAHGLNTKYENYLKTVQVARDLQDINKNANDEGFLWNMLKMNKTEELKRIGTLWSQAAQADIPQTLWKEFDRIAGHRNYEKSSVRQMYGGLINNFWIAYFNDNPQGTWIDFERDIKNVCESIKNSFYSEKYGFNLFDKIDVKFKLPQLAKYFDGEKKKLSYFDIISKLEKDLNSLIISFEKYVAEYINTHECTKISPDVVSLEIDCVLSFNYSNTYERMYNFRNNVEFAYIHGKAGCKNNNYGNIVLGYDECEYGEEWEYTIPFKKYYQRVLRETDDNYLNWISKIKDDLNSIHNVYFFGHSMDITDKDIICDLVLNKNVCTTIYYFSDDDKKKKLQNLVNTLGNDNFKVYTKTGRIKLKFQKDFLEKEFIEEYKEKNIIKSLYRLPFISSQEYKKIENWINELSNNNYCKKKYIYMALDALCKQKAYDDWISILMDKSKRLVYDSYSQQQFESDYLNYCSDELKEKNNEVLSFIHERDIERDEMKRNSFSGILYKIDVNHRMRESIEYYGPQNYVNINNLSTIMNKFWLYFERNTVEKSIYDEMVRFLLEVDKKTVEGMFVKYESDEQFDQYYKYKLSFLKRKYSEKIQNEKCL